VLIIFIFVLPLGIVWYLCPAWSENSRARGNLPGLGTSLNYLQKSPEGRITDFPSWLRVQRARLRSCRHRTRSPVSGCCRLRVQVSRKTAPLPGARMSEVLVRETAGSTAYLRKNVLKTPGGPGPGKTLRLRREK